MKPFCLQVEDILTRAGYQDRASLEEAIIQCGVQHHEEVPSHIDERRIVGVNAYQMPNQLAPFLLALNAHPIRNYLELGTFRGGTFYIVDTYLRLTHPEYQGGTALDVRNQMQDFSSYQAAYPATRFLQMGSLDYAPEQVYGLIFVDDDHSYRHLCREYEHYRRFARLLAFHDIVSTHRYCPGVRQFWGQIKANCLTEEFVEQYPGRNDVMGIGLVTSCDVEIEFAPDAALIAPSGLPERSSNEIEALRSVVVYANFYRVTGTAEEVIIDFGLGWPAPESPHAASIQRRIVTSFHTAKRMVRALEQTLHRQEAIFGPLGGSDSRPSGTGQ